MCKRMIHPGRGFDAEKMAVYEGDGMDQYGQFSLDVTMPAV